MRLNSQGYFNVQELGHVNSFHNVQGQKYLLFPILVHRRVHTMLINSMKSLEKFCTVSEKFLNISYNSKAT